jgi:ketosteroid isomerase-like protein
VKQWLAAFLALGLSIPAPAQSSHDTEKPGQSTAAAIIAPLRDKWARDLHDKQIDASIAAYDPDAEFIQPDGSRVRGATALRHLFETVTATLDSDIAFDPQRVETSGDLAYDSGSFRETLTTRATGKRELAIGSYLTVYRRPPNGTWLIVEQMWTGFPTTIALNLAPHPVIALTFDDLPPPEHSPPASHAQKSPPTLPQPSTPII